jgi:hypothetical protein
MGFSLFELRPEDEFWLRSYRRSFPRRRHLQSVPRSTGWNLIRRFTVILFLIKRISFSFYKAGHPPNGGQTRASGVI